MSLGFDPSEFTLEIVEPYGQSPWHLTNAQAGRHPGQKLAHSSTAKGRGLPLPG